jgi:hypothetical protein
MTLQRIDKVLPTEILDNIFLNYGLDFKDLEKCRELQSPYVKNYTKFDSTEKAIQYGNLDDVKNTYKRIHKERSVKADLFFKGKAPYLCIKFNYDTDYAAKYASLDVIQWMINKHYRFDQFSFYNVVKNKNIDVVKWFMSKGCEITKHIIFSAIQGGNLDVIKFLHKKIVPLTDFSFADIFTTKIPSLDIIKYLHKMGYSWYASNYSELGQEHDDSDYEDYEENLLVRAALDNNVEVMQYLKDNECELVEPI